MRRLGIQPEQIEEALEPSEPIDFDSHGKPRFIITVDGIVVRVVVAVDTPDLIVTVHEWRSK